METGSNIKKEDDTCDYCGRETRFHSEKWVLNFRHPAKRPLEEDSADVAYGKHRLIARHVKIKDEVIIWAGTRIEEVVCEACWDKGKRFKEFRS
jgi:hypothetical protein